MDFNETKLIVEEFFNGQYNVKKFLGEGSFANVYMVKHNFLDDFRAMKIIKQPLNSSSSSKKVFHEVQIATQLRHENIISIYDAGIISSSDKNMAYFVMEYVPGGDLLQYLNSFINSNVSMSIESVLDIIRQILGGLNVLHSSNPVIVHRDLKLNNILLSYNAHGEIIVKLSDFGFSKEVTTNLSDVDVAGTRPYMAPECFKRITSTRSDIYAMGVIFYQLLTNRYPYDIDKFSLNDILAKKPWKKSLVPPSEYNSKVSGNLDEIVMKCLKINPDNRYCDALDLLGDIELFIDEFIGNGEIETVSDDFDGENIEYVINENLKKAFALAKSENKLNEAIEILEKEILSDYDVRRCYGETLRMWKSPRPDIKLISKAFTVNLRGNNYLLSSNLLKEAIAYNSSIKHKYQHFLDLWDIFIDLEKSGNLVKAVISLEELMNSNNFIQNLYAPIITTLKTYSVEGIVKEAVHLADLDNLVHASNLMEFAVVCDLRVKEEYSYKLFLWKQNLKLNFKTDSEVKEKSVDFAIDLGTADSVISYYNDGNPVIIKNHRTGDEFTPSAVLVDEKDNVYVGEIAKNATIKNAKSAVVDFKNNMGFPVPYKFLNSSRVMFPEELSAEILKELRVSVFKQYGVDMEDVVICCPANSNPMKTRAINDAAELAGFKSHNLILEPIAVAIAYDLKDSHKNENWMIYDLGGSTFNVSIVIDNGGEIEYVGSLGLDNIGGNVFDWNIVEELFIPKIINDLALNDFNRNNSKYSKIFLKLKNAAEMAKKELSISSKSDIFINDLFEGYDFTYTINRECFKEIIKPYIDTTLDLSRNLLADNGYSDDLIDKIILVGGSSISPVIRDLIEGEFEVPLEFSIDPLTVVAQGAAIYAGSLEKSDVEDSFNEFSIIASRCDDEIHGRVFTLDDKFSFLGFNIEFIDLKTHNSLGKIPINIGGEFKAILGEGDYSIRLYEGNSSITLDEKSPNKVISQKIYIPYLDDVFECDLNDLSYDMLSKKYVSLLNEIDYLKDYGIFEHDELLEYLERLVEISQFDKKAINQASLYLHYLQIKSDEAMDDIEFSYFADNIKNKIRIVKEDNLFDIGNLENKFNFAIENKDLNCLTKVYNVLMEKYVVLNKNAVIESCFFNLIYEGIYSQYPEDLIRRALEFIDVSDYNSLFGIVIQLYKLDERNEELKL